MSLIPKSKSYSRRSVGVMLVVGVLAGLTVGGGVGVIAASTKTVTVCANNKTNMLRYGINDTCASTETKVVLNQAGAKGAKGDTGAKGATGSAGAKGDTGAKGATGSAGAKGDTGSTGAKGDTGSTGATGSAGAKGDTGSTGATGSAGAKGDAGVAGASSPTGFTARSVCGANGTTLCAVGVQGPGGGTIVYVDSTNEMPGYDYLEVAPTDAATNIVWSTTTPQCGTTATTSCQSVFLSDASSALDYIGLGTGRAATAAIVARHNAGRVAKASYAAGVADAYTTATASDWFLPSRDELNEVCKYAVDTGQPGILRPGFSGGIDIWSSSEYPGYDNYAWYMPFGFFCDGQALTKKDATLTNFNAVRPVRAF